MKKWPIAIMVMFLFMSVTISGPIGKAKAEGTPKPTLTEQQKKELEAMHMDMLNKEKAIIAKYVEFGLITKQAGDMLKAHMDKRFEKIKENGYIPPHHFAKPPHGERPESQPQPKPNE